MGTAGLTQRIPAHALRPREQLYRGLICVSSRFEEFPAYVWEFVTWHTSSKNWRLFKGGKIEIFTWYIFSLVLCLPIITSHLSSNVAERSVPLSDNTFLIIIHVIEDVLTISTIFDTPFKHEDDDDDDNNAENGVLPVAYNGALNIQRAAPTKGRRLLECLKSEGARVLTMKH